MTKRPLQYRGKKEPSDLHTVLKCKRNFESQLLILLCPRRFWGSLKETRGILDANSQQVWDRFVASLINRYQPRLPKKKKKKKQEKEIQNIQKVSNLTNSAPYPSILALKFLTEVLLIFPMVWSLTSELVNCLSKNFLKVKPSSAFVKQLL